MTVVITELKSLHHSLSRHLFVHKLEKYILMSLMVMIFPQIPFKVGEEDVVRCVKEEYPSGDKTTTSLKYQLFSCKLSFALEIESDVAQNNNGDTTLKPHFDLPNCDPNNVQGDISKKTEKSKSSKCPLLEEKIPWKKTNTDICVPVVTNCEADDVWSQKPVKLSTATKSDCNCQPPQQHEGESFAETQETGKKKKSTMQTDHNSKFPMQQSNVNNLSDYDDNTMIRCRGLRALYMITRLSFISIPLIVMLLFHDLWIEMSGTEIKDLKKFLEKKENYKYATNAPEGSFNANSRNIVNVVKASVELSFKIVLNKTY